MRQIRLNTLGSKIPTKSLLLDPSEERMAIVDAVSVRHTRPVGGALYKNNTFEQTPDEELDQIHALGHAIDQRQDFMGVLMGVNVQVGGPILRAFDVLTMPLYHHEGGHCPRTHLRRAIARQTSWLPWRVH